MFFFSLLKYDIDNSFFLVNYGSFIVVVYFLNQIIRLHNLIGFSQVNGMSKEFFLFFLKHYRLLSIHFYVKIKEQSLKCKLDTKRRGFYYTPLKKYNSL